MTRQEAPVHGPHQAQPVSVAGKSLDKAGAAMVLVHGRGATAQSILSLVAEFAHPDFAYLAPQAAGNSWYPHRFLAPIPSNEPYLSSALASIGQALNRPLEAGISREHIILLGFSQGACLALEFAARQAQRYGGVIGLSGGLIGPDGSSRDYAGSLESTPVFLGCSDPDVHIPKARVLHSAEVFQRLGGQVTVRLYPNMGHTVNQDELDSVRSMVASVAA